MSEEKSSNNFINFLITAVMLLIVAFIGGIAINYFLSGGEFSITSQNTLSFALIIFGVMFMFYIISVTGKDKDSKLKGKDKMENFKTVLLELSRPARKQ